jgi:hypothetical protein
VVGDIEHPCCAKPAQPEHTNRFAGEVAVSSQHAHYPSIGIHGGQRSQGAPGKQTDLLSVGYSTCHWCMSWRTHRSKTRRGHESQFVNIKADREERPDVDRV